MKARYVMMVMAGVCSLAAMGCLPPPPPPGGGGGGSYGDAGTGGGGSCNGSATLSGDVQPILSSSCGGCHGGLVPSGGVSLAAGNTYGSLVGVTSNCNGMPFVDPGNPSNSYLMSLVTGQGLCLGGSRMPLGGALSQSQIDTISAWICSGAQNN